MARRRATKDMTIEEFDRWAKASADIKDTMEVTAEEGGPRVSFVPEPRSVPLDILRDLGFCWCDGRHSVEEAHECAVLPPARQSGCVLWPHRGQTHPVAAQDIGHVHRAVSLHTPRGCL